jgi:putative ABC transport system permease protein
MPVERWLSVLRLRWQSLTRRRELDRELEDELRDHVEARTGEHIAGGAEPAEARRRALAELGGLAQVTERCRDTRGLALVESLVQDVRYGARALVRDIGFTSVAILTLALGVGANLAVFSLVDGILLAPLPFPAPERLVSVTGTYPQGGFAALRREAQSFDVGAYVEGQSLVMKGSGEPVQVMGARVSAEFFHVLDTAAALGRTFRASEDLARQDGVVVISHRLWQQRLRGDAGVIGRFVEVDGIPREVVGVMPPTFRFPSARTELWVPLGINEGEVSRYWGGHFMPVIGRLRPGATLGAAQAEIGGFQARVLELFPWRMPDDWNNDVTVVPLRDALVGPVRPRLWILVAAVLAVLVTACANVSNLSLTRAMARDREFALRLAVGAGPGRIARQILTESAMLASAAAVAGVVLATQAVAIARRLLPADTPRIDEVHLSWRVLAAAAVLAMAAGLAFGLAPAVRSIRLPLRGALDAGGRGGGAAVGRRWRGALTIAQVACAVLLVIAAGLLVRSLWTLSRADPGFRPEQVQTVSIAPGPALCAEPGRCLAFYRELETSVQSAPGVVGAALVNTLPLTGAVAKRSLELEGYRPPDNGAPLFWLHVVTPGYFKVMGIRLEAGRGLAEGDRTGARVALVSASTARRFWPDGGAIGRHVRFVGELHWHQVVGVVADVRAHDLSRTQPDFIDGVLYVPYGPAATLEDGAVPTTMTLAVRTALDATQTAAAVRGAAGPAGGDVVIGEARSMRSVVAEAVAAPAAIASLLTSMAAVALALGAIGVYGVLSFLVAQRSRDFAIRMALGASPGALCWHVVKEGGTLVLAGTVVGVVGAAGLMRWLSSELHGVTPTDPTTYAGVIAVMAAVSLLACYVPTRRAMRVDPLTTLRQQ